MAIESEPSQPYAREDWCARPRRAEQYPGHARYAIQSGDSLVSIAARYHLSWQELTEFNWGTSRPAEVNWYLARHTEHVAPTRDGKNCYFVGGGELWVPAESEAGECAAGDEAPAPPPAPPPPPARVLTHRGGKFDLVWDQGANRVTVVMRLEWNFSSDIAEPARAQFRQLFHDSIMRAWNTQQYHLEATRAPGISEAEVSRQCAPSTSCSSLGDQLPPPVSIHFDLRYTSTDEHWDIEVKPGPSRSNVNPVTENINLDDQDQAPTMAHEFGHAFNLPDEYDSIRYGSDYCKNRRGGYFEWTCVENWIHDDRYFADLDALMNVNKAQLRARYFFEIRDWMNEVTNYAFMYQVRPLTAADQAAGDDSRDAVNPYPEPQDAGLPAGVGGSADGGVGPDQ